MDAISSRSGLAAMVVTNVLISFFLPCRKAPKQMPGI
jgi:hypothetical protein